MKRQLTYRKIFHDDSNIYFTQCSKDIHQDQIQTQNCYNNITLYSGLTLDTKYISPHTDNLKTILDFHGQTV